MIDIFALCEGIHIEMSYHLRIFFLLIYILLTISVAVAQSGKFHHQLMLTTENDCYTSINDDGYYTNGLKLSFSRGRNMINDTSLQKVNRFEIGQLIFNAKDGHYTELSKIDRPVTGYLYGTFQQSRYNKKQDLLRWEISGGVIGKHALGNEVQNFIHHTLQLYQVTQWKYELQPDWGLNATVLWSPHITKNIKSFDIKPVAGVSVGNFFTNAMIGTAFLLGKFNGNSATSFWNNHYGDGKKYRENYIYLYPSLRFQAYDATIQGGMFNDKQEIVTGKLNRFLYQIRTGWTYSGNKLFLGYMFVYENKESLTQRYGQYYGSISFGIMW